MKRTRNLPALVAAVAITLVAACGGSPVPVATPIPSPTPTVETPVSPPVWRYVNSGWVSPVDYEQFGPYASELRAFVITNQAELDAFNRSVISKRTLGNSTSLGRVDFPTSLLLAAYYIWKPVQGDPLSVVGLEVNGSRAIVDLELDDDAQGRLYPYLFAPMTMVSVDRALFPTGAPVDFVFQVNGEPEITVSAVTN